MENPNEDFPPFSKITLHWQGRRRWPQAVPGEVQAGDQEEFIHGKDGQALERGLKSPSLEGSEVSIPGRV